MRRRALFFAFLLGVLAAARAGWAGWGDAFKKIKEAAEDADRKRETKALERRKRPTKAHAAVRGVGCAPADISGAQARADARDFDGVDRLESAAASEAELSRFASEGGLAR